MATARPWTDDDTTRLTELHGQGMSLHGIAKEMGRSKGVISPKAAALGLSFDRTRTAQAAQAVHVDNKARRGRIVARMYTRMEHLQDRLEAEEFKTVLKGEHGCDETRRLDFVPTADERNIADTLSRYVAASAKLEAVDSNGAEQVRSLLGGVAEALGLTPPAQPTAPAPAEPAEAPLEPDPAP